MAPVSIRAGLEICPATSEAECPYGHASTEDAELSREIRKDWRRIVKNPSGTGQSEKLLPEAVLFGQHLGVINKRTAVFRRLDFNEGSQQAKAIGQFLSPRTFFHSSLPFKG
ncbi:hypothetical protein [Rhodoplanes sp. Z2-YC6860]|uniref:hypothetical protein n=1 Tax=Rhodoplanes sp. Z2-YC6860 TaxID=674703 RepID=UPI0012ED0681|nr:hypothetical protein [Rhodoplanes sp. Z2-YC6860]